MSRPTRDQIFQGIPKTFYRSLFNARAACGTCWGTFPPSWDVRSVETIRIEAGDPSGGNLPYRFHKRSEEHTSELQSHSDLVCRLLLEKKKYNTNVAVS